MASPDHAATAKANVSHFWTTDIAGGNRKHIPDCSGCKVEAAVDALVAALTQAEHEGAYAIRRLNDVRDDLQQRAERAENEISAVKEAAGRWRDERDAETVRADLNETETLRLQEHVEKLALRAERAERQRDQATKALRGLLDPVNKLMAMKAADVTDAGLLRYDMTADLYAIRDALPFARDVLAAIEKDTA